MLYRVWQGRDLLVIPSIGGLRELIISEVHDSLLGGHLGVTKCVAALRHRVWWLGLEQSVREYVRACPICQRAKDSTQLPAGAM